MLTAINGSATFDSTEITDVGKITINDIQEVTKYGSSSTNGVRKRAKGHTDWTITVEAKGDMSTVGISKGDTGSLVCKEDDSDGQTYTGTAIVENISVDVDIDAGTPIATTFTFGAMGTLAKT